MEVAPNGELGISLESGRPVLYLARHHCRSPGRGSNGQSEGLEIEQLAAVEGMAASNVPDRQAELAHDP